MDPLYSVTLLSAPPTPNLMGVIQSKCASSQAFPACCPLWSLPELYLLFLSRLSSGYILCSVRGHLGWCLVSSEGLNLLVACWQIVYRIPTVPYFSCLCHAVMGIKRFDHRTKVKARSEKQNLQTASQLCTKQVGTGEINQIIESLLKVKVQRITKTY